MYKNNKIGVVVPAHNEERFITEVLVTMPGFVDKIYVIDDGSTDKTYQMALLESSKNEQIVAVNRPQRGGVGAAILTGHVLALEEGMDVIAVMAGDGQMDPAILTDILDPIVEGKADYSKGNRLSRSIHKKEMPAWRAFGNFLLTSLSRISTGYWHMSDPQDGYTAISAAALRRLDLNKIEKGFAFENNMLAKLNVAGARVVDVPHPAIYRGQNSKINYSDFIIRTSLILFRDYLWRIWAKYVKREHLKH